MTRLQLDDPVDRISGVGPVRAQQLAAAGIETVGELLLHLPARYEDRRRQTAIVDLRAGESACVLGVVASSRLARGGGRRARVEATVEDEGGSLAVVWFNQPYMAERVAPGNRVMLYGRVAAHRDRLQLVNPVCHAVADEDGAPGSLHLGRVVPVYRRVGDVTSGNFRRLVDAALGRLDEPAEVLPGEACRELDLLPLGEALGQVHQPPEAADWEQLEDRATGGHRRLGMQELLEFQTALLLQRKRALREPGVEHRIPTELRDRVESCLPFTLTGAQARCLRAIYEQLGSDAAMHRLIQGDVGSGKTAVAGCALLAVAAGGEQAALLAPTEILAAQHAETLREWAAAIGVRVALLTGSTPVAERREILASLREGNPLVVVGTHALLQPRVEFARLGLVIIDEQHRFGVVQRARLRQKGRSRGQYPDLLVMTATPIPRSLALTLYGDLDVDRIDEMPPGRSPVATSVLPAERWQEAQERIGRAVQAGNKVFVVVPRIEAAPELRSVEEVWEQLRRHFGDEVGIEILHGAQSAADKAASMLSFAGDGAAILVATTVVEVGVDVPAASLMVIEHAERFGLAQLHQLRGRVGRGPARSECLLVAHEPMTDLARQRLRSLTRTSDGFRLAEDDLRLRGPGELLGARQTGTPGLALVDPFAHPDWVVATHRVATRVATSPEAGCVAFREHLRGKWRHRLRMSRAG